MQRSRDLRWDGCLNVRDLGGHRTADGGETRFGAVVRADSVRQLSEEGWMALVEYGITTLVDLRGDHEREADPPAELPVEVLHVPFMEANRREWEEIEDEIETVKAQAQGAARTRDVYLIFLQRFRANVAAAVRAVARAPEGGVVVHCVGGKDRTGLLTAFLLHIAGVSLDEIAADYALSKERLRPREKEWLAQAETEAERAEIRQTSQTPAEVILGVFSELERSCGTVEDYLRWAGVEDEDLALVRSRLRG